MNSLIQQPNNLNNLNNTPVVDFLDVSNKQLTHTASPINSSPSVVTTEFLKITEDIWKNRAQLHNYQKGLFLGKGDQSNILFQEFLKKFRKTLEEIIRDELKTNNLTSETFKDDFRTLEFLFNMILYHLKSMNVEIKDEKFVAILHGFITSYINSIVCTTNN